MLNQDMLLMPVLKCSVRNTLVFNYRILLFQLTALSQMQLWIEQVNQNLLALFSYKITISKDRVIRRPFKTTENKYLRCLLSTQLQQCLLLCTFKKQSSCWRKQPFSFLIPPSGIQGKNKSTNQRSNDMTRNDAKLVGQPRDSVCFNPCTYLYLTATFYWSGVY